MASLLYLAHHDRHSDEAVVQRWSESLSYQHFSGGDDGYYEHTARRVMPAKSAAFVRPSARRGGEYWIKATVTVAVRMQ